MSWVILEIGLAEVPACGVVVASWSHDFVPTVLSFAFPFAFPFLALVVGYTALARIVNHQSLVM